MCKLYKKCTDWRSEGKEYCEALDAKDNKKDAFIIKMQILVRLIILNARMKKIQQNAKIIFLQI